MEKTAIITGASRGIGKACAIELAKHFEYIVINSFTHSEDLEDTKIIEDVQKLNLTFVILYIRINFFPSNSI